MVRGIVASICGCRWHSVRILGTSSSTFPQCRGASKASDADRKTLEPLLLPPPPLPWLKIRAESPATTAATTNMRSFWDGRMDRRRWRKSGAMEMSTGKTHPEDVYVSVLATPNPDALRFMPGCDVTGSLETVTVVREGESGTATTTMKVTTEGANTEKHRAAATSLLAAELMEIPGVTGLMFGFDFLTLRKEAGADWNEVEPQAVGVLQKHAADLANSGSGEAALVPVDAPDDGDVEDGADGADAAQVIGVIREILAERVRPNVQADGGDVHYAGFKEGVVYVSLTGACTSCPSSTATVRVMIRNLLCHMVDQVKDVRQVMIP